MRDNMHAPPHMHIQNKYTNVTKMQNKILN